MSPASVSAGLTVQLAVVVPGLSLETDTVILKECTWRNSDRWFRHETNEVIVTPWSQQQEEHFVSAAPWGLNCLCFLMLLCKKISKCHVNILV